MKLAWKIYLLVIGVGLMAGIAVSFLIVRTEAALENRIGHELYDSVAASMDTVDRMLFMRMEEVELQPLDMALDRIFERSNRELESIPNAEAYIQKVDADWKQGRTTPAIEKILSSPLSREFKRKIQFLNKKFRFFAFSEIMATNKFGTLIGCYPRTTDFYQADEDWFQRAVRAEGLSVEDVEYDESSDALTLRVSRKVVDDQGRFEGLVAAGINLKVVEDILDEIAETPAFTSLRYFLVDRRGSIILSNMDPAAGGRGRLMKFGDPFPLWPSVRENLARNQRFHYLQTGSGPSLVAHVPSKGYRDYEGVGWNLIFVVDRDEALAPVVELKTHLLGVFILMAMVLGGVVTFFVRSITRPIERLTRHAEEISHGEWHLELAFQSKDEIGSLAQSFNRMIRVIKTHQDELEEMVEKRTREALDAKRGEEEARELERAKSLFLVNMSHEVRTPLNAILGYSQILQRSRNLTEEEREKLQLVCKSGEHLLALINDILDLSRIEAQKESLETHEFNLSNLVHQISAITKADCSGKELRFKVEAPGLGEDVWVTGDEGKLRRVLVKILNNAVKFTDEGGVLLRVIAGEGDRYRFEVLDTGPGIPPDEQEIIFEPFRQGALGQKKGGTGMGLAISKRLVEIMGGRLGLRSQPGKGSQFFFTLVLPPALRTGGEDEFSMERRGAEPGSARIRALLIDDNPTSLEVMKELISSAALVVETADSGEQGLALLDQVKPDIIFVDQQMPGLKGVEVMQRIHEKYGKDCFKVVITTASTLTYETEEFLEAGADAVLRKPVIYEECLAILRKLLKEKFAGPPSSTGEESPGSQPEPEELDYASIVLPASLWKRLTGHARMGLYQDLEKDLAQLETLGGGPARLAERLRPLTKRYESKKILKILERVGKDGTQ